MSVTFEHAIATLISMFPEWDEETLSALLVSNNYHVERTIEAVLAMSGDAATPTEGIQQNNMIFDESPRPPVVKQQRKPDGPRGRGRGVKCDLPDDFLRPPGWGNKHTIIADEELAMMLQNEKFQNQAREVLGDEFLREHGRPGGVNEPGQRSISRDGHGPRTGDGKSAGGTEDLGILKALSSMGSAAKKNLIDLAQRFQGSGSGAERQDRVGSNPREFKPLLDDNEEDDEENEVITFDTKRTDRSKHLLQQPLESGHATQRNAHSIEEEEGSDSENPLIQFNNKATNAVDSKKTK